MRSPLLTSTSLESPALGLAGLDQRARDIFRRIVETYLETGEPVGSRTLSHARRLPVPASIRNTMQDLTMAGLLAAPHTSAGRIPTHAGLRLFVDGCWRSATSAPTSGARSTPALRAEGQQLRGGAGRGVVPAVRPRRRGQHRRLSGLATPGSNTSSSSPWATIRRWRCWSATTARSRTG
jgi:hypothetical protein